MSITKSFIVLGVLLGALSLGITACGSHEDALKAMADASASAGRAGSQAPSPDPSPAKKAASGCDQRNADLKDLEARAQAQLEDTVHRAFSGFPARPTDGLRTDLRDIENKSKGLDCDPAVMEKSKGQILRTAEEIDQLR